MAPQASPTERKTEFLESVAKKLALLLSGQSKPERERLQSEAELMLEEAGMLNHTPPRSPLPEWCASLIVRNPPMLEAASWAMSHNLRPGRCETSHELIASLIPSEGGL